MDTSNAEPQQDARIAGVRELYAASCAGGRKVLALLGPTNSGKTHHGLNQLAGASTGIYLAPLRLMALENQEALKERGLSCSLLTGEEVVERGDETHASATIEMFPQRKWGAVLIDEIQMLADNDRGWAWSRAYFTADTDLLILAGSVDALPLIERLAQANHDKLEVIEFERRNGLEVVHSKNFSTADLKPGDAVIAFSRNDVLDLKAVIARSGQSTAAIYGNLGPEARREEARRFRDGEADILIATDTIGMGLNLPIDRVIFSRISKFDGRKERRLTGSELRQIAGRAGRFSATKPGYVAVLNGGGNPDTVSGLLQSASSITHQTRIPVSPDWSCVERVMKTREFSLEEALLTISRSFKTDPDYVYPLLESTLDILRMVRGGAYTDKDRFRHIGLPLNMSKSGDMSLLAGWVRQTNKGHKVTAPGLWGILPKGPASTYDLQRIEEAIRHAGAYL